MSIAHLGLAGEQRQSGDPGAGNHRGDSRGDRVPPHDLLAEQSAIGGMLQTPTTIDDTVVFTAGFDGAGSYTVTLTGAQNAGAVNIARGNVTLTGGSLTTGSFNVSPGATGTISSPIFGPPYSSVGS